MSNIVSQLLESGLGSQRGGGSLQKYVTGFVKMSFKLAN